MNKSPPNLTHIEFFFLANLHEFQLHCFVIELLKKTTKFMSLSKAKRRWNDHKSVSSVFNDNTVHMPRRNFNFYFHQAEIIRLPFFSWLLFFFLFKLINVFFLNSNWTARQVQWFGSSSIEIQMNKAGVLI